jgi:phosphopantetheine--protein transferase-like protein
MAMTPETIASYLARLLNREVGSSSVVQLSSAQRARLVGWLESQGASVDSAVIRGAFFVHQLAREAGHAARAPGRPNAGAGGGAGRSTASGFGGVGIDIQSVAELVRPEALADLKGDPELRAIFSLRELSYAEAKGTPAETLAGIFAAKEALRKADPRRTERPLVDIEILPDESGAPCVEGASLSISHSAGVAVAVAICHVAPGAVASPASEMSAAPVHAGSTAVRDAHVERAPPLSQRLRRYAWLALLGSIAAAIALWLRSH